MRSNKPYTNATFTHRVNHLAGLHRGPRATKAKVCERCGAVYYRRRWALATTRIAGAPAYPPPATTVCPACRATAEGRGRGELRVGGGFLAAHAPEIDALIRNEEARAAEVNPLARIVRWDRNAPDALSVVTTTEHLAKRLGQALHKAFDGSVEYHFSHETKAGCVIWTREAQEEAS